MAFTSDELDALARLAEYNSDTYNVSTNPYGLGGKGYKQNPETGFVGNWQRTTEDIATMANAIIREAQALYDLTEGAKDDAEQAAEDAADVVANALTDTTATSIDPTLSTPLAVTLAVGGTRWDGAAFVTIYSASNPSDWSYGPVSAFNGTTGLTYTRTQGDGSTFTDGVVIACGPAGPSGAGTGDMLANQNLADVDDVPTARGNLGLAYGTLVLLSQIMS